MRTSAHIVGHAKAVRAWDDGRKVRVELEDSRTIVLPVERFRRLNDVTEEQFRAVRIEARGLAPRSEELDEDLSIDGILAGR